MCIWMNVASGWGIRFKNLSRSHAQHGNGGFWVHFWETFSNFFKLHFEQYRTFFGFKVFFSTLWRMTPFGIKSPINTPPWVWTKNDFLRVFPEYFWGVDLNSKNCLFFELNSTFLNSKRIVSTIFENPHVFSVRLYSTVRVIFGLGTYILFFGGWIFIDSYSLPTYKIIQVYILTVLFFSLFMTPRNLYFSEQRGCGTLVKMENVWISNENS